MHEFAPTSSSDAISRRGSGNGTNSTRRKDTTAFLLVFAFWVFVKGSSVTIHSSQICSWACIHSLATSLIIVSVTISESFPTPKLSPSPCLRARQRCWSSYILRITSSRTLPPTGLRTMRFHQHTTRTAPTLAVVMRLLGTGRRFVSPRLTTMTSTLEYIFPSGYHTTLLLSGTLCMGFVPGLRSTMLTMLG